MEFRILGPLEVGEPGRPLALGGAKQRALLAILLLHANEPVSTDRLIEDLWGERPPADAGKSLQIHVSRLRKTLGPADGIVVTQPNGYLIKLGPNDVDLQRFERLAVEGRRALAGGDVGESSAWVANSGDGSVTRIDRRTNQVVESIPVGHRPQGVAVAGGAVWVTLRP